MSDHIRSGDPIRSSARVPLVRLRNLIGLALFAGVVLAAILMGTPYLRFDYVYVGSGRYPIYIRCTYLGLPGFQVVRPASGHCPLVQLMKPGRNDP